MPRTKEQNEAIRAERRQLIMDNALKLFANKGYEATSISDIAKAAKISKGLMYNYFDSKENVLQSLWDELSYKFSQMIDPNQDGEVTQREAENFIDSLFDMLINGQEEMKLYLQISFQPEVIGFITQKYDSKKALERQGLIVRHFAEKLPIENPENAYLTMLFFFKGLTLVLPFSESIFDAETLENYKNFLKSIFFK
jgi:AcrR family transcriptional regulator